MQRPNHALTQGAIGKTLFLFTLPILAGNVLQSLNGSVNAIWIGHGLGEAALAAASNANTILFFLLGAVFGIGMAATILVGQSIGANDIAQTKRVIGTSLVFFVVASVAIAVVGLILSEPLMEWMRMPADAKPLAIAYLRVIFLAIPFVYVLTFIGMTLRGAGDARTPFIFLAVNVVLDIVLNPLFIFGFGPVPAMGIAGSATATLVATVLSLVGVIAYLYSSKHFLRIGRDELHHLKIDPTILKSLIVKGVPMGLQMVVMSTSMIAMISLVNSFGAHTTAAYGACFQLWNYIQMPSLAVGMAASSMAAQNVGAGLWDRVNKVAMTGVGYNFLLTGSLVVIVYLFNRGALGLFLPADGGAIEIAQHINHIAVWSFILFGISFVLAGVVRSTGAVIPPLIILVISLWVVRIPFAYSFVNSWGADAVWWSFPVGSAVSMTLSALYYRYGGWRKARMLASTAAARP
ncbi:MAG: MATE family efflux transporter [Rudaea sp.]|uniref:MATE family efflux transporter n=1 Tax=unclassified Rudaea TaxID=2627037 RepID=UPI0010F88A0C|nr:MULTISPECIES: MATE family efflux transporter [unclassified Rudaea]MBN8887260.1 MATE family efflux transporter [Rudaea sp.]MBR0346847.1 MATE family efflux transporter [Rudaea sp.]